jgi:hypothetical protein
MPEDQERRYFVTVAAEGRPGLRALAGRGLDLFSATARIEGGSASVEGHLRVGEIVELVESGHTVTIYGSVDEQPLELADSIATWAESQGIEFPGIVEFETSERDGRR